jgi:hypothetical protein
VDGMNRNSGFQWHRNHGPAVIFTIAGGVMLGGLVAIFFIGRAVIVDQPPRNGEPDAEASLAAIERAIRLNEQVPDARHHLGGDPNTGVADPDDCVVAIACDDDIDTSTDIRLLDVARITQSRILLRKESLYLAPIIERAIESSRSLIESRGLHLAVALRERGELRGGSL